MAPGKVRRDPVPAEDECRRVLLELDLALRTQAHPHEQRAHRLAELRLREQQEVLLAAAPHDERSDDPRLRGQQQRGACLADLQGLDVIRDHPLQVVARVRSRNAEIGPLSCCHIHDN